MKKRGLLLWMAALLALLAACGADDGQSRIKDAAVLLETVWNSYGEDERFPAAGGDMSEENMTMDAPGKYSIEDAEMLDSALGFPQASAGQIDGAASLMHMMNANTFTCGAYHVKDAGGISDIADALRENILERQWICGFPDKLVIAVTDDYVISFFGDADIVNTFKEKLFATYSETQLIYEEKIE